MEPAVLEHGRLFFRRGSYEGGLRQRREAPCRLCKPQKARVDLGTRSSTN